MVSAMVVNHAANLRENVLSLVVQESDKLYITAEPFNQHRHPTHSHTQCCDGDGVWRCPITTTNVLDGEIDAESEWPLNGGGRRRRVGVGEEEEEEEEKECAVCLLDLEEKYLSVVKLSCCHDFHEGCMVLWVDTCTRKSHPLTCPMCRQPFESPF